MDSTLDDAEAAAATTTPPRNETEDHDSTDVRAATRGDEIPSSTKPPRRDGSPSSVSTNSLGFVSPSADASGERSSKALSTPRLPSTGRASSDYEGSEVLSMRGSLTRSSRRLFRDNSIGPRSSSTRSVLSHGSTGSSINPKASVSAAVKAAADGDARSVVQFLNSGGGINAKCKTSASTPLSRAAAKGHLKIVKLLLDRGAGVNIPGRGGLTPLHEAAGCGKVEVCRLLLGGGAAVAANDHSKRTPLHYSGTSVEVTKLLLEFGADPNAQDKNGQRPDAMAISHEARGLLRDARCTVREDAVGNNASRVIASLRRELENLEREAQAAKESASEEEVRRKEVQLEVDELRGHVSKLSQENDILRKEAAETGPIEHVSEAAEAELKQMRASLRVARAAASEEKRRRENLEDSFDSHVAEAVAKAIAVAASRLLDRMPDSEEEEEEEEGAVKRAKRGEDVEGDGEEQTLKSFGGNAWGAEVGEMEPDHGDGDADLPEPVRAVPSAWGGKRKDGGKFGDGDDADGGDADGDDGGSDAEDKEEEQGGKGFVEQRTDELLEATAGLLPRSTTLLRQWYSVGATPPRQAAGSPTWVSTKGYEGEDSKPDTDCSGCSDGDAGEEGGRMLTVKTRSFENVLQGERTERIESGQPFSVARSISARVPLETVGSDWTGTNEDNQDELGTVPGAAAPPSTTSEDRVQGADMGKYIPASGDERDSDGSIHDEAVVEPSTFEPDGTAATLAAAEGAPRESSVSPGHEIGVSAEPIAARGDESPGDGAETAAGQFSVARSFSARVPLETVGADWTGTNEDNQDELGTVPGAAAPPSTTSEDRVGADVGKYILASGDERDSDGSIHDEVVVESSTFEPDGTAATLAAAEGAPRESSVSPGHEIGVSAEPIAARGDESPGDGAETAAGQFSVARSISTRVPLETVGADWTGTNEVNQDEPGTVPGAAAPHSTSEDRVQGADMGKYIPASGDEGDGDGSIHDEAVVEPSTPEPDGTAATLAAAEGAPRESSVSIGHGIGVSAEPIAARGDESPGDGAETAAGQFSVARSFSARVPLETIGAGWTGTNEDNQDDRETVPGAAAPPSTTSEDSVQGADTGKCIPAPGDEGDSDGSIHDEAVVEPCTPEPDGTAATLAAAEGAPRESSVSPGHGIGVIAESNAARGDESPGDGAERAAGQKEGAATGGLGGDAVPLVLEDLAEEMVAAFGVENEEDDYYRYEGDDEDYYDDDDDDDDIDFFNYLSKYETESSKDVGQTTDARVWEGLAAALKVELEEKKARIFDLSIENRRLRREAADWAMQCAYQKEQNHHEQLERQQQQEQQQQQQRWWQQWWEQLWWGQGQQEDVEISLHERVGMRETEPEPEGGILGRMSRGIPRVAHPYWKH